MPTVRNFVDCLAESKRKHNATNLFLGNGFSIGASSKFSYQSLYQASCKAGLPLRVEQLFNTYGTANFEQILRFLHDGAEIADLYELESAIIRADYDSLKCLLAETISSVHPHDQSELDGKKLDSCRRFIRQFNNLFTVSYDLLVYWANFDAEGHGYFSDGFGRIEDFDGLVFKGDWKEGPCLYFLHGALHLFHFENGARKLRRENNATLLDQAKDEIKANEYPLVITEGKSSQKWRWIQSNNYLRSCWEALARSEGSLFVYGHSLSDQDEHLIDTLSCNTSIEDLYVGLHGDPENSNNAFIDSRAKKIQEKRKDWCNRRKLTDDKSKLKVSYFSSNSAQVWDDLQ